MLKISELITETTEYTQKIVNKSIKEFDVCLTFDDSLKCQFDILYPELEKRKLKAFFFVYSGAFFENPPMLEFFRDFRLNFFRNVDEYYELFFETIRCNHSEEYSTFGANFVSHNTARISAEGERHFTLNKEKKIVATLKGIGGGISEPDVDDFFHFFGGGLPGIKG